MARFVQAAILMIVLIAAAEATCTVSYYDKLKNGNPSAYSCTTTDFAALAANISSLPSAFTKSPVIFYRFDNTDCSGYPYEVDVYKNHTCAYYTGSNSAQSATCSSDGNTILYNPGSTLGCFSSTTTYQNAACYLDLTGTNGIVYLCPGDLTTSCSVTPNTYRNAFTLRCVPQSVYTGAVTDISGPVQPTDDVLSYRTCDIYYGQQVSTGFAVVSQSNKYCCRHRGIINNGICEQGTCGGYTTSTDYYYGNSTNTENGQYCYNDCYAFGDVNAVIEQASHFNGDLFTGIEEYNTQTSNDTDVSVYITFTSSGNVVHEVGYYIVPVNVTENYDYVEVDASNNTDYGCRYLGTYTTPDEVPTCTVLKGCNLSHQMVYTSGFLYSGNNCFAECYSEGEQFPYTSTSTRKRSVDHALRSPKQALRDLL